jgi:colanic acid biosynthesis glycosyl transferase WcaI
LRYARENIDGIDVWRSPILTRAGKGGTWRAVAPMSFAIFAAPLVLWRILSSKPSVVICVEPTLFSIPAALLAAKLTGARTVLHVQDLEVDAAFEVGHLRGTRWRSLAQRIESALLRSFDLVVTISDNMRKALVAKGVSPESSLVIRNWVQLDSISRQPLLPNTFREELGLADTDHVVLYAGHLGKKQALENVVAAATELKDHDHIKFVIAGEGPEKPALQQQASHLRNVSFIPLQPVERLNELLALANVHVLPQCKAAADLVLPSKLGGMLASGRPIVVMADKGTELATILERAATIVASGDVTGLASAISDTIGSDLRSQVENGLLIASGLSADGALRAFASLIGQLGKEESSKQPVETATETV